MSVTISKLLQFRLFPKLPYELRLEIWRFALPPPRVVELRQSGRAKRGRFWITDICPPVLLSVCHEAREVALELYRPILVWNQTRPVLTRSYIAYSKDIVYLSDSSYKRLLDNVMSSKIWDAPVALDKVQYFAVISDQITTGYSQWSRIFAMGDEGPAFLVNAVSRQNAVGFLASIFRHFKNLKQLLLVTDKRMASREGMDELLEPTDAYEDCCDKRTREIRTEKLPGLLEEVQAQNTNLNVPPVHFKVLIKSQQCPLPERRSNHCMQCRPVYELEDSESDFDD